MQNALSQFSTGVFNSLEPGLDHEQSPVVLKQELYLPATLQVDVPANCHVELNMAFVLDRPQHISIPTAWLPWIGRKD